MTPIELLAVGFAVGWLARSFFDDVLYRGKDFKDLPIYKPMAEMQKRDHEDGE